MGKESRLIQAMSEAARLHTPTCGMNVHGRMAGRQVRESTNTCSAGEVGWAPRTVAKMTRKLRRRFTELANLVLPMASNTVVSRYSRGDVVVVTCH